MLGIDEQSPPESQYLHRKNFRGEPGMTIWQRKDHLQSAPRDCRQCMSANTSCDDALASIRAEIKERGQVASPPRIQVWPLYRCRSTKYQAILPRKNINARLRDKHHVLLL